MSHTASVHRRIHVHVHQETNVLGPELPDSLRIYKTQQKHPIFVAYVAKTQIIPLVKMPVSSRFFKCDSTWKTKCQLYK